MLDKVLQDFPKSVGSSFLTIGLVILVAGITNPVDKIPSSGEVMGGNYISIKELNSGSEYWNTSWQGNSSELYEELVAETTQYFHTHEYVLGEFDCDDMAVEMWQKLTKKGITPLIVVGNLQKSNETFLECNHAWLTVFASDGSSIVTDPSQGEVYTWDDALDNPQLVHYWEGFIYALPSDLIADFRERW